jgi:hypothetical protein
VTNELIRVYPDSPLLQVDDRQQLHQEILEKISLGEFRKKDFAYALKQLCFHGKIESYRERILDPGELISRINALGTYVQAYICLASPVVEEDFFLSILSNYKDQANKELAGDLVIYFDCKAELSDELFQRMRCLLRALKLAVPGALHYQYIRMFTRFLSRVSYDGSSAGNLTTELLSGEADTEHAYEDAGFCEFMSAYFGRRLGANLLAYLDEIYHSISEDRRIRMENGSIVLGLS